MTRVMVAAAALIAAAFCRGAEAGDLRALVTDQKGGPVQDAVVVMVPRSGVAVSPVKPRHDVVDQIDQEFVPYVKAVLVGTPVEFPNNDGIRHHVYSFSPPKVFELPLYVGRPANPIVFDRPGVVTLGCNIHDWMVGHVYVSETPYFGTTGSEGRVTLGNLPPGPYVARVWHPSLEAAAESTAKAVIIEGSGLAAVVWQLTLKQRFRPRRAPVPGPRGYR
jgi:hypothetical protein